MAKIDELNKLKKELQEEHENNIANYYEAIDNCIEEIKRLHKEFEQKIKRLFRGVEVKIQINADSFALFIGRYYVINYAKNFYNADTELIKEETARKVMELYIEYFGEL